MVRSQCDSSAGFAVFSVAPFILRRVSLTANLNILRPHKIFSKRVKKILTPTFSSGISSGLSRLLWAKDRYSGTNAISFKRPLRLARPRTPPFHGGDTGSNPVGDAKYQKVTFRLRSGLFSLVLIVGNCNQVKGFPGVWVQFSTLESRVRIHVIEQSAFFTRYLLQIETGSLLSEFE